MEATFYNYVVVVMLIMAQVKDVYSQNHLYPLELLRSEMNHDTQVSAVRALLKRLISDRAEEFLIVVDPELGPEGRDTFQIDSFGSKIQVTGTSGVAASLGLNYYLKYYCNCHVSWSGDQLNIPKPLPAINDSVKITTNDGFRYYQNVCTASYSSVWWNWTRWEREIDWMALNGINLPLAFTGQEFIWNKVYKNFGLSPSDLVDFFTGPAFLAWNRMGNVQKWGGPLPDTWHLHQVTLQINILNRMREFGMIPVLPAFGGHVPSAIKRLYPNASTTTLSNNWGSFNAPYGDVLFLEPNDPLFHRIGTSFLKEYTAYFGTNHVYSTDLFNEMPPPSTNISYLENCGTRTFQAMTTVDPKAVWLMQGWLFGNDPGTWQPPQAKALLTSVPIGRMLVLDLEGELDPQYTRLSSFFGQPFIWCMLHNFGGVLGLYGSFNQVNEGPFSARSFENSTMIGTGLTPEGIEQNDIMYELMNEMAWQQKPVNPTEWLSSYATRRYGKSNSDITKALNLLQKSVFSATAKFRNHGKYIITTRPTLSKIPYVWYNASDVFNAWELFIQASQDSELADQEIFRYDLVDVTRQALQLLFDDRYIKAVEAFHIKCPEGFSNASGIMLGIFNDMETLLASNTHFLLGRWLESAKTQGFSQKEKNAYEYNARNQITLWGPDGQIMDYANKQWSGVISGYFQPRWEMFLDELKNSLEGKKPFSQRNFNVKVREFVEEPFTFSQKELPTNATGDSVQIANDLWNKYKTLTTYDNYDFAAVNSAKKTIVWMRSYRKGRKRTTFVKATFWNKKEM